jgi:hypothetical protein
MQVLATAHSIGPKLVLLHLAVEQGHARLVEHIVDERFRLGQGCQLRARETPGGQLRGAVGLKAELRPAGVLTAENGFLEEKLGD